MRVQNPGDHGVFVQNYGVVPAGEEATVRESPAVKQQIKDGVLKEVKSSSGGSSGGGSADKSNEGGSGS
jgi:hypothetical protein